VNKGTDHPNYKHGHTVNRGYTPEYSAWYSLRRRCGDPNTIHFYNYGGRGITVCDRWKDSFTNFLEDMGYRPGPKYSVDRVDNSKGYSPDNCKWTTRSTQMHNSRTRADNSSGYRGVSWYYRYEMWVCRISLLGVRTNLGYFPCKHEAAMVYDMFKEKHNIPPYGAIHKF